MDQRSKKRGGARVMRAMSGKHLGPFAKSYPTSKAKALAQAIDGQLEKDDFGPGAHNRDGLLRDAYQKSGATLPIFIAGVGALLQATSPYRLAWQVDEFAAFLDKPLGALEAELLQHIR